jgi:hypothetical protein
MPLFLSMNRLCSSMGRFSVQQRPPRAYGGWDIVNQVSVLRCRTPGSWFSAKALLLNPYGRTAKEDGK